jgi:hypothetical protein
MSILDHRLLRQPGTMRGGGKRLDATNRPIVGGERSTMRAAAFTARSNAFSAGTVAGGADGIAASGMDTDKQIPAEPGSCCLPVVPKRRGMVRLG